MDRRTLPKVLLRNTANHEQTYAGFSQDLYTKIDGMKFVVQVLSNCNELQSLGWKECTGGKITK